ncbi:hypothetical protein VPH35_074566 [Triticum aestivum]
MAEHEQVRAAPSSDGKPRRRRRRTPWVRLQTRRRRRRTPWACCTAIAEAEEKADAVGVHGGWYAGRVKSPAPGRRRLFSASIARRRAPAVGLRVCFVCITPAPPSSSRRSSASGVAPSPMRRVLLRPLFFRNE